MAQDTTERQPMGIGLLGDASLVFARKFRYTFGNDRLPAHFMRDVKIDYTGHSIRFSYYNVQNADHNFNALQWLKEMEEQNEPQDFVLRTYDGCGSLLYTLIFHGVQLLWHTADYSYESSDVACEEVRVKFTHYDVECSPPPKPLADRGVFQPVAVPPKDMEAESTKVRFLNSVLTLPGRLIKRRQNARHENIG